MPSRYIPRMGPIPQELRARLLSLIHTRGERWVQERLGLSAVATWRAIGGADLQGATQATLAVAIPEIEREAP